MCIVHVWTTIAIAIHFMQQRSTHAHAERNYQSDPKDEGGGMAREQNLRAHKSKYNDDQDQTKICVATKSVYVQIIIGKDARYRYGMSGNKCGKWQLCDPFVRIKCSMSFAVWHVSTYMW